MTVTSEILFEHYRGLIVQGDLKAGDLFPTYDEFARQGIRTQVVADTRKMLKAAGYIAARRGERATVIYGEPKPAHRPYVVMICRDGELIPAEAKRVTINDNLDMMVVTEKESS